VSLKDQFLAYLDYYSNKDINRIAAMFAEDITLRDWNISVSGKDAAISETLKNFENSQTIEIETLFTYESEDTLAGELKILVDSNIELYVVDVIRFDSTGKIKAIRAYLGRGVS
jgi:steroid delta-isomerase